MLSKIGFLSGCNIGCVGLVVRNDGGSLLLEVLGPALLLPPLNIFRLDQAEGELASKYNLK